MSIRLPMLALVMTGVIAGAHAQSPAIPLCKAYTYVRAIGGTPEGLLDRVIDVAVDSFGNVFVADASGEGKYRIDIFRPGGEFYGDFMEPGDTSPEESADSKQGVIRRPTALVIDKSNRLLVGTGRDGVLIFDAEGNYLGKLGEEQKLRVVSCIRTDAAGNIYVGSPSARSPLLKYDAEGRLVLEYERKVVGGAPTSIAIDSKGRVYAVGTSGVFRLTPEGKADEGFKPDIPKSPGDEALAAQRVAVDGADNLYLAVPSGRGMITRLVVLNPEGKRLRAMAVPGNVAALLALPDGSVYVAAQGYLSKVFEKAVISRVLLYKPDGTEAQRYGTDLTQGCFNKIQSMAATNPNPRGLGGEIVVCDRTGTLHSIAPDGTPTGIVFQHWPCMVVAGPSRSLYLVSANQVQRITLTGQIEAKRTFFPAKAGAAAENTAKRLVDLAHGAQVLLLDQADNRIIRIDPDFEKVQGDIKGGGTFEAPSSLALSLDGKLLYLVEVGGKHRLLALDPATGALRHELATGLAAPTLVRVGPDGGIFVLEAGARKVSKFAPDGQKLCEITSAGEEKFVSPVSFAVNCYGYVFVGDSATSKVHMFQPSQ